jgi:LPXTG-motif cell wall-anchored protein
VILSNNIYFNIEQNGSAVFTDESGTGEASYDGTATLNGNVITVINTPGNALPHTGGPGTGILYILGSLLALGCGIVLVARRRMHIHK